MLEELEDLEGFDDLYLPTCARCPACEGRREQTKSRQTSSGDWVYVKCVCSACEGTGVVSDGQ